MFFEEQKTKNFRNVDPLNSFTGTFFKKYKMFIPKKSLRFYRDLFKSFLKYVNDFKYQKKKQRIFSRDQID